MKSSIFKNRWCLLWNKNHIESIWKLKKITLFSRVFCFFLFFILSSLSFYWSCAARSLLTIDTIYFTKTDKYSIWKENIKFYRHWYMNFYSFNISLFSHVIFFFDIQQMLKSSAKDFIFKIKKSINIKFNMKTGIIHAIFEKRRIEEDYHRKFSGGLNAETDEHRRIFMCSKKKRLLRKFKLVSYILKGL